MFGRNHSIRCRFLSSSLKDAFSKCPIFPGKLSVSSSETGEAAIGFDEEDEIFVSAIISKYMESKCKRKLAIGTDTFKWALSPEHFLLAKQKRSSDGESREECSSAGIRLSRCSSATSYDAFFSVKSCFSRSSSMNKINMSKRSALVVELFQCEGWPFGLCKKAFLLPPLPKSPPDSWSWRNN